MTNRIVTAVVMMLMSLSAADISQAASQMPEAARECAECHGDNGISQNREIPIIAGMSALYIEEQLLAYQDQQRPCAEVSYRDETQGKDKKSDMCRELKALDAKTLKAIAVWLSTLPFVAAKQSFDPALAATGATIHQRSCEKCHANGAASADDDAGVLAGQWRHYLLSSLNELRSGKRVMDKKMAPKIKELDDKAIAALVEFYVSRGQQP